MVTSNGEREAEMPSARSKPRESPPAAKQNEDVSAVGTSEPKATAADIRLPEVGEQSVEGRPVLDPSGAAGARVAATAEAVGGITATWRTNMTVAATWSIDEIRNAWMYVNGLGWRKLYNGRDGAFTALVTLATHARQTGRPISFREESDGMVYEIYVW
jgi:hypothetical protein